MDDLGTKVTIGSDVVDPAFVLQGHAGRRRLAQSSVEIGKIEGEGEEERRKKMWG